MTSRRTFLAGAGACLALPGLGGCGGADKQPAPGVPVSQFDDESTAEDVTAGIDLKGKLAVVTGCTSGIGFETMRVLAARGCYVVGTSRSLDRAREACLKVKGLTTPIALELGDPDSVVECGEHIRSLNTPIDILCCNAGVRGGSDVLRRVNGIERHFAINHLGHFLLVNRLAERLYLANQGRIVIVASRTAYNDAPPGGIDFSSLEGGGEYSDRRAYGQSKLANVLFAYELGKRLRGTRITANAVHPGVINTEIDRDFGTTMRVGFGVLTAMVGKTVEQGAATSCYVATNPRLGNISGEYFEDCNAVRIVGDPYMRNDELAVRLWDESERLVGPWMDEIERPDYNDFENGIRKRRSDS